MGAKLLVKENYMKLSIIIPTWNGAAMVTRVLPELEKQSLQDFELLIIDNGVVNQETEELCRVWQARLPQLRYLAFTKQLGYAGAVNEGVKAARANFVAVLNNDNLPHKDFALELYEGLKRGESKKLAVLSASVPRPGEPDPILGEWNLWGSVFFPGFRAEKRRQLSQYSCFHPDGSSFIYRKDWLGLPYEEEYFIYHEDVYLGWRARLLGYKVELSKKAQATTFDGGSTRRIAYRTAFYTERNRWINLLVFLERKNLLLLFPWLLLESFLKLLLGQQKKAKFSAYLWLCKNTSYWKTLRTRLQAERREPDAIVLAEAFISTGKSSILDRFLLFYAKIFSLPHGERNL